MCLKSTMNVPDMAGSFIVKTFELRKLLWDWDSTDDSIVLFSPSGLEQTVFGEVEVIR